MTVAGVGGTPGGLRDAVVHAVARASDVAQQATKWGVRNVGKLSVNGVLDEGRLLIVRRPEGQSPLEVTSSAGFPLSIRPSVGPSILGYAVRARQSVA